MERNRISVGNNSRANFALLISMSDTYVHYVDSISMLAGW